jgi:sarcosine oxidase subunit gamma
VAELRETAPFAGLHLPLTLGAVTAAALPMAQVHAVAPYPGRAADVAGRLGGFPAPGQVLDTPAGRLVWAGREAAFLWGTAPDLAGLAAVTDQSDGWAGLRLEGADAAEVLARLVPVDLATLGPPAAIRSQLNHLPLLLIHPAAEVFELWSYRSMAGTLVHEGEGAMRGLAARRARG